MLSSLSNSSSTMIHWPLECHVWPGREADAIPIRPLFPWTCFSIYHFCHMLSTHSHLDQTQGPTASVNSKEIGRLFHETAQATVTLALRNSDEQLLIIYYSQVRDQWVNQLPTRWTEFFISLKNIGLRKILLSKYIRLSPLCLQKVVENSIKSCALNFPSWQNKN